MKKLLCLIAALLMLCTCATAESHGSALDAFYSLTGTKATPEVPIKTSAEHLADIMSGAYTDVPADPIEAVTVAAALESLTAINSKDIAAYASQHALAVEQVRNAYYRSLANVLRAEIMVRPASEERYKNIQVILSLFLEKNAPTETEQATRQAIRKSMTPRHAATIAQEYQLPAEFVEFVIMDEQWDDDRWENDDDWKAETDWYDDVAADFIALTPGVMDDQNTSRVADMQAKLIALGYLVGKADGVFSEHTQEALRQFQRANGMPATGVYDAEANNRILSTNAVARWDYQNSFDDSPYLDDSPDYDNSADKTDSPDYDNSADKTDSPDYDNSADKTDSPSYDNSPDTADSPDYDNSPDNQNTPKPTDSPDYDDSPENQSAPKPTDSPDYDNSPDQPDSPDYEDS